MHLEMTNTEAKGGEGSIKIFNTQVNYFKTGFINPVEANQRLR